MGQHIARLQRQGPVISLQRFGRPFQIQKRVAALKMGLNIIGIVPGCVAETGKRLVQAPKTLQRLSTIEPGPGIIRLKRNRPVIAG